MPPFTLSRSACAAGAIPGRDTARISPESLNVKMTCASGDDITSSFLSVTGCGVKFVTCTSYARKGPFSDAATVGGLGTRISRNGGNEMLV